MSLSDKIHVCLGVDHITKAGKMFTIEDVKEAVKELKEEMKDTFKLLINLPPKPITPYMWKGLLMDINNGIDEVFGELSNG